MRLCAVLPLIAVAAALIPSPTFAGDTPARTSSKSGWYLAGKGGPSFAALRGVEASQSGRAVNDTSASNLIGAFGMAVGYEWMYHHHIPLRTELEFVNRTEVTYDASPVLGSGTSGALASTAQNVTTLAKVYWHFPVDSEMWWPFVSAGREQRSSRD